MLQLFDIGNTSSRVAYFENNKISGYRKIPNDTLFDTISQDMPSAAACVVPKLTPELERHGVFVIHALMPHLPIDFSLVEAEKLGGDRLANIMALASEEELPGCVIDCGTCINLEVVNRNSVFLGGAIMPGRRLQRRILHLGTGALPEVALTNTPELKIGTTTESNINFGLDTGSIGAIKAWLDSLEIPLKTIIFTGGDAGFFLPFFPTAKKADHLFTLRGVAYAYCATKRVKM